MSPRVLVVEDDLAIADAVVYALEKDGMHATRTATLAAAGPLLAACDAVVLDLTLSDGSGFTLLRAAVRRDPPPRVVVLTSHDEEADCVAALEAGADDYVTKPFSPRVLVARVRAVLRRDGARRTEGAPGQAPRGLSVDGEQRRVTFDGREITLTRLELDLLAALVQARGRVLTRDQLVDRVWGDNHAMTPRTVDSHVKALRRKLAEAGAPEGLVETVRAVGFRWKDDA